MAGRAVVQSGRGASLSTGPASPGPPSAAVAAAVAQGACCWASRSRSGLPGDASSRPTSAAGDKAITLSLVGRGKGAWWIQTVVAAPAPTYPSTRSGGGRYPFLVGLLPRCGLGSSRALAAGREASRPVLLDLCDLYVLRFQ